MRGLPPVVEVGVGDAHRCARTRDGVVWCRGSNEAHQLGRRTVEPVDFRPRPIPGVSGARRLAVGGKLTCVQGAAEVRCRGPQWYWIPWGKRVDVADVQSFALPLPVADDATIVVWRENMACVRRGEAAFRCWKPVGPPGPNRAHEAAEVREVPMADDVTHLLQRDRCTGVDTHKCRIHRAWNGDRTCRRHMSLVTCDEDSYFESPVSVVGGRQHVCGLDAAGRAGCDGGRLRLVSDERIGRRRLCFSDAQFERILSKPALIGSLETGWSSEVRRNEMPWASSV